MYFKNSKKKRGWRKEPSASTPPETIINNSEELLLTSDLETNLSVLQNMLGQNSDVIFRDLRLADANRRHGALLFINNMVDQNLINRDIIRPLISGPEFEFSLTGLHSLTNLLPAAMIEPSGDIQHIIHSCNCGYSALLVDGFAQAALINVQSWKERAIEDSQNESVVRGPRQAFTESLGTNITLLRRRIKNPDLTLEMFQTGRQTKTDLCLVYLKTVANPKLIREVRLRLNRIDTDAILESGYIEQFIEDAPFSIFPTVGNSERPDTVAAKILEGRVAILVDGSPFMLTMPFLFWEGFQNPEDYYSRPYLASLIRIIRFLSYLLSIFAPAVYIALTSYHQELIPTPLLFTIAATREGVPFPVTVEMLLMVVTFEILREAGVRLPRPIGQAVSIVGALVLGEASVSAGLIGSLTVIVIAFTAVASFVVPTHTDSGSILRLTFIILAGMSGGFGIVIGILIVLPHLNSLRSFGAPYLAPLAVVDLKGFKDLFIRFPIWSLRRRPKAITQQNPKRQAFGLKPEPPEEND